MRLPIVGNPPAEALSSVAVAGQQPRQRRRERLVALVVVALLATTVTPTPALGAGGFSDVSSGGVHEPAIEALADRGVFTDTECGDGLFCPDEPIDRWVMAVWLIRVLGDEVTAAGISRFGDVDSSEWWSPHTEELANRNITAGCATVPLRYCPDQSVTRAQMATFLHRALLGHQAQTAEAIVISDDVPNTDLVDLSTAESVNLRSFVTGDKAVLLWFWSPY